MEYKPTPGSVEWQEAYGDEPMRLERDKYKSRVIALTGNDTLNEVLIDYWGGGTVEKGLAIDNEVIPAIIERFNAYDRNQQTIRDLTEALEDCADMLERCPPTPEGSPERSAQQARVLLDKLCKS